VKKDIAKWSCPAIIIGENGKFKIDINSCVGCGMCVGVFKPGTIKVVIE